MGLSALFLLHEKATARLIGKYGIFDRLNECAKVDEKINQLFGSNLPIIQKILENLSEKEEQGK